MTNAFRTKELEGYALNNYDATSDPVYLGYEKSNGYYVLKEINLANETVKYFRGYSAYATAWTARAAKSYDTYHAIFTEGG